MYLTKDKFITQSQGEQMVGLKSPRTLPISMVNINSNLSITTGQAYECHHNAGSTAM